MDWNLYDECEEDVEEVKPIRCPYCGGEGDREWFENHEHVDPFAAQLVWSERSELFAPPRNEYHGD